MTSVQMASSCQVLKTGSPLICAAPKLRRAGRVRSVWVMMSICNWSVIGSLQLSQPIGIGAFLLAIVEQRPHVALGIAAGPFDEAIVFQDARQPVFGLWPAVVHLLQQLVVQVDQIERLRRIGVGHAAMFLDLLFVNRRACHYPACARSGSL